MKKNDTTFFGFKGHVGVNSGSPLIRREKMTSADIQDSQVFADLIVGDEDFVGADKAYGSDEARREVEANNSVPVIPGRVNRREPITYDKTIYRLRRRIEMFFGKIKENRRLAVHYEKTDNAFLGFIALATIPLHLC